MIQIFPVLPAPGMAAPAQMPEQPACAAQAFLRANGYLSESPSLAPGDFPAEVWDSVRYRKYGVIEYAVLIRERRTMRRLNGRRLVCGEAA